MNKLIFSLLALSSLAVAQPTINIDSAQHAQLFFVDEDEFIIEGVANVRNWELKRYSNSLELIKKEIIKGQGYFTIRRLTFKVLKKGLAQLTFLMDLQSYGNKTEKTIEVDTHTINKKLTS